MAEAKTIKPQGLKPSEQELVEELEVARLRKQIKRLKTLPKNFRDMQVMGKDWRDFAEIMGPEKKAEMLVWAKGGVLCVSLINELERKVLQGFGKLYEHNDEVTFESILRIAETRCVSFVYASSWPRAVITGLNWLASDYGWNFRFKGQLLGGTGKPLGI